LIVFTLGRYRISSLLGIGGMGVVYRAEQHHPQRTVAIKVIRSAFDAPELLRRFRHEAEALGRLKHHLIPADRHSAIIANRRCQGRDTSAHAPHHRV